MSNDYTPTTDEAFDATLYTWIDWKGTFKDEADAWAAWGRMIAEVERAAAEAAWWEACVRIADGESNLDIADTYQKQNPYLEEAPNE